MPSIDLPHVRAQAGRLAELLAQPEAFAAALREVLDEHAERAFRPGRQMVGEAQWHSRGVPDQVLKALAAALRPAARQDPSAALEVLPRLWAGGIREERMLAAEMLGAIAPQTLYPALDLLAEWVARLDTPEVADALGASGFAPLLRAQWPAHHHRLRRWLADGPRYARRFAVMALLPLAQDKTFQSDYHILEILDEAMNLSETDVRRAVVVVLRALAEKSPVETAHYLRDWAAKGGANAAWIVRRTLAGLPEEWKSEVGGQRSEEG